tara:strand:+ start:395 stop:649 length:255 start_codon:yes stop_codon:yes gene_type:complete
MKVDNNNYANGKTVEEMQEQLDRCLAYEEKYQSCVRSRSWIKWCTSEDYRRRSRDFNRAIIRSIKAMGPIEYNNLINNKDYGEI